MWMSDYASKKIMKKTVINDWTVLMIASYFASELRPGVGVGVGVGVGADQEPGVGVGVGVGNRYHDSVSLPGTSTVLEESLVSSQHV